jgi:hypothetical protein
MEGFCYVPIRPNDIAGVKDFGLQRRRTVNRIESTEFGHELDLRSIWRESEFQWR